MNNEQQIVSGIVIEQESAARALRETEARLAQELADSEQLQKISAALIEAGGVKVLYQQILDAAVTVMHSEMASMQMFHPERNELELLAYKGFHPDSAAFWKWVRVDSGSTCGAALRTGERVIVEDVETCEFMAGTADLDAYRKSGIRAVQSTPLVSRSGRVLGMISNHWREPHLPSERDWRLFGILTRQAADLIERNEAEAKMRDSEQKLKQKAEELEKQLIASGRLVSVGEITASMAHEFNNPLGIVIGFAEDLLTSKDPSDPDFHALQIIHAEAQRCATLMNHLIEFAQPRDSAFSHTDIGSVVAKSLTFISNRLHKAKIEAVTKIAPNLPLLPVDAVQIEQVLLNLYLNAIDAMPDGGKLIVEAATTDSTPIGGVPEIIVSVADSGNGIDERILPHIFQPFFTINKNTGLGLGLPTCERIIKNHGGRIDVESQFGKGTTFKLHLPIRAGTPTRHVSAET